MTAEEKVGDTFRLGLQWNTDGTVKLFVDYKKIAQIDKAAALASWAVTGDAVTYGYANLAGDVKVTVSDPVILTPLTEVSMESEIHQSSVQALFDSLNPNLEYGAVKGNVTLPVGFTSAYMGGCKAHGQSHIALGLYIRLYGRRAAALGQLQYGCGEQ